MSAKKTILITGCSAGGIGCALAQALAQRGYHIFATARNTSRIPSTLMSLSNVTTLQLDVTSASSVSEAVKAVAAATQDQGAKGLDVLVNNAGSGYTMPLLDADLDIALKVYDANVFGPLRTVQAFADLLIEKSGRVVNVSSIGAVVNTPWIGIYSSSKSALTSFSETLRLELASFGISVVTLMVGTISTPFHANQPSFVLPPTSRYEAIKDTIARRASGKDIPRSCSADEFAELVVGDVVGKGRGGQVWKGPNSSVVKLVSKWVPASILDGMMATGQGLDELARKVKK